MPFLVGATAFENGTGIRDRNPVIEYSPYQHEYLLVFEMEIEGSTNLAGVKILGPSGEPANGLTVFGQNNGRNMRQRRADIAYRQLMFTECM
eukprot:TRINITY_DN4019_c0_g1_i2.p1 TRINITY_DN4019_c0_g1~~TRINITY_DN4019_c0_g1_i2.p1  ORF type:complete len:92 (+),score=22.20 TRINITY_DN4019_c0_g1_i2:78-353(+)